jgi:hypothetical protein
MKYEKEPKIQHPILEDFGLKTKPGLSFHRTACLGGRGSAELYVLLEKKTLTPVLPLTGGIMMKLRETMDAYKKSFEAKAPKDVLEILHRATEDLRNSGILDRTVKVGDKAPDFSLRNTREQEITLADQLSKGPVVLGFYRGRW